jgi:hypothetical protein
MFEYPLPLVTTTGKAFKQEQVRRPASRVMDLQPTGHGRVINE